MTMEFKVNQIFNGLYPVEAAIWCNNSDNKYQIIKLSPTKKNTGVRYKIVAVEVDEEKLKEMKRKERNLKLEELDKIIMNPLRWDELTKTSKTKYKQYRNYLLDFTDEDNWWNAEILSFDDWASKK